MTVFLADGVLVVDVLFEAAAADSSPDADLLSFDSCDLRPVVERDRTRGAGVGVPGEEVTLSAVRALPFVVGVPAPVLFLRERERDGVDWPRVCTMMTLRLGQSGPQETRDKRMGC